MGKCVNSDTEQRDTKQLAKRTIKNIFGQQGTQEKYGHLYKQLIIAASLPDSKTGMQITKWIGLTWCIVLLEQ